MGGDMEDCNVHDKHAHDHSRSCGHKRVKHGDHWDYLHDGHLHYEHDGHYDEHRLDINESNPEACNAKYECSKHEHGDSCGHLAIPHGDHVDYSVNGRLHHPHGDHCDDHGPVYFS